MAGLSHTQLKVCCSLALISVATGLPFDLEGKLQAIADANAKKYNCSISIAVRTSDDSLSVAGGIVDFGKGTKARATDKYAWGSCTKMHTAGSIMNLVSKGAFTLDHKVSNLVDDIMGKMQKVNPDQDFSKVEDLWGANITTVTLRQLLGMKDGVPDFDTAKPSSSPGGMNVDPLRAALYKTPDHFDTPSELMSFPWVAHQWADCKGLPMCYSSTNFMLLGFVLAQYHGVADWKDLDQSRILPEYLKNQIVFAKEGTPVSYDAVRGYDRTSYNMPNGTFNDHDNGDVKGVFAGWTASNLVTSAAGMANMTWEIYGTDTFAPKKFIDQMIPPAPTPAQPFSIYGLGTFNLGFITGQKGRFGQGYGHLGATYGYQSISAYFPGLDFSLAIGTNIETDTQVQPSDTMCLAYNEIAGAMLKQHITCTFEKQGYYGGACKCNPINVTSTEALVLV